MASQRMILISFDIHTYIYVLIPHGLMMLMQILQLWEEAITSDSGLLWLVTLGFRYFVEVQEKPAAAFCLSNCPTEWFEEYFEKSSQQQIEPSTVILGYTVLIPDWTWIGFRNADPSCEDERWSMAFWYYHSDYVAIVYRVIVWWVCSYGYFWVILIYEMFWFTYSIVWFVCFSKMLNLETASASFAKEPYLFQALQSCLGCSS